MFFYRSDDAEQETTVSMMLNLSQDLRGSHQPGDLKFPLTMLGNNQSARQRSCQPACFDRYKWLHYEEKSDSAFCYTCIKAVQNNMISSSKVDWHLQIKAFETGRMQPIKRKAFKNKKHARVDYGRVQDVKCQKSTKLYIKTLSIIQI